MSERDLSQNNSLKYRLARRLCFTPILYPLIRVQTFMQSHLTFPIGEKLPTFRESIELARKEGGLFKGLSFYLAYNTVVFGCYSYNPILGLISLGLFYPLELAQVYMASHGTSHINAYERIKRNLFSTANYKGMAINYLVFFDPSGFYFNNIKRNLILSSEEGNPSSYRNVVKSLSNSNMILRGAVPGLLMIFVK